MKLLELLHREGYQRLRWFSYFAPTGCSFRCHITTQNNICANRELISFKDWDVWKTSVGNLTTKDNVENFLPTFKRELGSLLDKGKGDDPEYVGWYKNLHELVIKSKKLPKYTGEFYSAPLGHIMLGNKFIAGPPMSMTIISWNIDGIKAHFDSLNLLVDRYKPEIICLQKTKDIHSLDFLKLPGYRKESSNSDYAGVITYIKDCILYKNINIKPDPITEGHILIHEILYPHFFLLNIYVPYSNPKVVGAIEHRKAFDKFLLKEVIKFTDRKILCGDMNIIVDERDCWDKKFERKQANFHDWERKDFLQLLEKGYLIDTYRTFHQFDSEFSYFFRNDKEVRVNNQGYRIDYFLASHSLLPNVTNAEIIKDLAVSTNNPIVLKFNY